jgi:predicted molibdopterin-dependent oxidoreductase YjgC
MRRFRLNLSFVGNSLSYPKLRGANGIQWPCNELTSPLGTERLYTNGVFSTKEEIVRTLSREIKNAWTAADISVMHAGPNMDIRS